MIEFMPTYLKYKLYFFLHFELRSDSDPDFFSVEPDPEPRKTKLDPHP